LVSSKVQEALVGHKALVLGIPAAYVEVAAKKEAVVEAVVAEDAGQVDALHRKDQV
jgi:hypothetical protein